MIFNKKDNIACYNVLFPIKEGEYAETYRVQDESGNVFFLKLIRYANLKANQFTKDGKIIELEISKMLNGDNLCKCVDTDTLIHNGQQFAYIVSDFISGETVAERMARDKTISVYDAKQITKAVLNALTILHGFNNPVIHNEITPQNVMIDLLAKTSDSRLIDFGHARFLDSEPSKDDISSINPFYLAPERFNGVCSVQSDLYSVGVMMYQMIFGVLPWYIDISNYQKEDQVRAILSRKCSPLRVPSMDIFELDEQLLNIMAKAMSQDITERFQSTEEFIQAIDGKVKIEPPKQSIRSDKEKTKKTKKPGNGFADIAGMDELKKRMENDVIKLLKNPQKAEDLGLTIPNGILLYGPPGCGKTFFAQKFAEEAGFNFMERNCSDVASPYIHGGQDKIAAMFEEARENAPTILFLDEVDALITDRSRHTNVSEQGEVNVFLTQLNNCGEDNVLVIAATNNPDLIDKAALRSGRLEYHYYIPLPDKNIRREIFKIEAKKRKVELGIDYDKLADMTENFTSSDITFIMKDAGRIINEQDGSEITQSAIEEAISKRNPVSDKTIKEFESLKNKFEGKSNAERPKIGFN